MLPLPTASSPFVGAITTTSRGAPLFNALRSPTGVQECFHFAPSSPMAKTATASALDRELGVFASSLSHSNSQPQMASHKESG